MPLLLASFRGLLLLLVGLILCSVTRTTPAMSAPPVSAGRALLIGINKYQNVPQLRGSINDIEAMRQVLLSRFGFSEEKIQILKDQQATRANILAALEKLVREAGPEDMVVIHFAGHGSQVQDLNGDEEDGLDETLVPVDGRTDGVPDIIDDQLDEILSRLKAQSALIVLDSCHSGTATRSLEISTRSVPQDMRIALYEKSAVQTRGVVPLVTNHYVLMTGAASHQQALDGPIDGKFHGFFSYALTRSLGSALPSATPREIFSGAERELKRIQTQIGLSSMPEPQLEATANRLSQPLLPPRAETATADAGSNRMARLPWVEVVSSGKDGVILLNGVILGALPGSVWGVYPPGETKFAPGKAQAMLRVVSIRGPDAVAGIENSDSPLLAGSRAVALAPPAASHIPIRFVNMSAERKQRLEGALRERLGDIRVVGPSEFARFVLEENAGTVRVSGGDGLQPLGSFPGDDRQLLDQLVLLLTRSRGATELMALDNPASMIQLTVRVASQPRREQTSIRGGQRGLIVVADTDTPAYRIRRDGQPRTSENSLQLEVQASADCFLTIADVDSQGGVNILFPNPHQRPGYYPEGRISGRQAILLPDSLQSGNQAGFHWDYGPPPGMDTIRVFASSDLATAKMIRQAAQQSQSSASFPQVASRSSVNSTPLVRLRGALLQVTARGLIVVPDESQISTAGPSATPPYPPTQASPPASTAATNPPTQYGASTMSPAPAPGDWAAASVTVLVGQ
jgi:hypothetical protein